LKKYGSVGLSFETKEDMNVLKVCGAGAAVFNGHAFYVTT